MEKTENGPQRPGKGREVYKKRRAYRIEAVRKIYGCSAEAAGNILKGVLENRYIRNWPCGQCEGPVIFDKGENRIICICGSVKPLRHITDETLKTQFTRLTTALAGNRAESWGLDPFEDKRAFEETH